MMETASISLSSVQSLCDVLSELPLPSALHETRINNVSLNNVLLSNEEINAIRDALINARADVDALTFNIASVHVNEATIVQQLRRSEEDDDELSASLEQTLETETETQLMRELHEEDDDVYSSLGDRVKSQKRKRSGEFEALCEREELEVDALPVLVNLATKLKRNDSLSNIPNNKLNALQSTITQQLSIWSARSDVHWEHCCDASLIALTLMTSSGVSLLHEECLESIVAFLGQSLSSTIAVGTSKKSPKKSTVTSLATKRQTQRWSELIELLTQLLRVKRLTDSLILSLTRVALCAFFLDDNQLQMNALQLTGIIFGHYPRHRGSILEELLHQIARAPTSKRHMFDAHVTMFSALLMTLTHQLFNDDENAYDSALRVTSAFLNSFLRKCCGLQAGNSPIVLVETDLRAVFEALVADLARAWHRPQWPAAQLLSHVVIKLCVSNLAQNAKNTNLQLRVASIDHLATLCSRLANDIAAKDTLAADLRVALKNISDDDLETQLEVWAWRHLMRYFKEEKLHVERDALYAICARERADQQLNKNDCTREDHVIDAETATNIIKYFDIVVHSTTCRLFDAAIAHVTASLSLTSNTTQRSRAMRALSLVLTSAPQSLATQLLARADLQVAMRAALLDASTSVREATIDLIGRFMLSGGETLLDKYIDLIADRVLDAGVSVRKRVIRILREVCCTYPKYARVGELCARILKRINDDGEGIRKLVAETFATMWFSKDPKVDSLLHVVGTILAANQSLEPMTLLLDHVFGKTPSEEVLRASRSIVATIVDRLVQHSPDDRWSTLSAMTSLWLFARVHAPLLADHVSTLQPFLSLPCSSQLDVMLRVRVLATLESAITHVTNPSQSLLSRIEEDLTKNILQCSSLVLQQCVSCLAVVIHVHTHNNQLVNDLFTRFSTLLHAHTPKTRLSRALLSCGLLAKHFDLDHAHLSRQLRALIESNFSADPEITGKALAAFGYVSHRAPQILLDERELISRVLNNGHNSDYVVTVLNSLRGYLSQDTPTTTCWTQVSLKSIDVGDDIQSTIVQQYLSSILTCTLSRESTIRRAAVSLVHVIHSGGHVHPLQLVPHLVAMSSDDDGSIRARADHVLGEIERKYQGFVAMKTRPAISLSHQLNARGYRIDGENCVARLSALYSVVTHNRQTRRALLSTLLKHFECEENDAAFVADNIALLPFSVADEPLYVLHSLDTTASVSASHTHALFKEILGLSDDEEEEMETTAVDVSRVPQLVQSLRHVYLVSWLRSLLRDLFVLSEAKCNEYSPNEAAKVWDKPIHRKHIDLNHVDSMMHVPQPGSDLTSRDALLAEYERFKSTSESGVDPNRTTARDVNNASISNNNGPSANNGFTAHL